MNPYARMSKYRQNLDSVTNFANKFWKVCNKFLYGSKEMSLVLNLRIKDNLGSD